MRGRKQEYQSNADRQRAYRQRKLDQKRNTDDVKRNARIEMDKLYFAAIQAIRALYEHCDGSPFEKLTANSYLSLINRAAFDAQSGSVFRYRRAAGLKNSSSPLEPEFDKQWEYYERKH